MMLFNRKALLGLGLVCHMGTAVYASHEGEVAKVALSAPQAEVSWNFEVSNPERLNVVLRGDMEVARLSDLLKKTTQLRSLELDAQEGISSYGAPKTPIDYFKLSSMVEALNANTTLTHLTLNNMGTQSRLDYILSSLHAQTDLQTLFLNNCFIGTHERIALRKFLTQHGGLAEMVFDDMVIGDVPQWQQAMEKEPSLNLLFGTSTHLQVLQFSGNKMNPSIQPIIGASVIPSLFGGSGHLRSLGFLYGDGALACDLMKAAARSTTLELLKLRVPRGCEEELEHLMASNHSLTKLSIFSSGLVQLRAPFFDALGTRTSLMSLYVSRGQLFDDVAIGAFAHALCANTSLRTMGCDKPVYASPEILLKALEVNGSLTSTSFIGSAKESFLERNRHNASMRALLLAPYLLRKMSETAAQA